ncbi:MAG: SufB/SufD family protein [bacterium]
MIDIVKAYEEEFDQLVKLYEKHTQDNSLRNRAVASIIVSGNRVVGLNTLKGIDVKSKTREDGVVIIDVTIEDNTVMPIPVHLCTGFLEKRGEQLLKFNYYIGNNVKVKFKSHCILTKIEKLHHKMISDIYVGRNSTLIYEDEHFHDENGGIFVETITYAKLNQNSFFQNKFSATKTRIGKINVIMDLELMESAKADLESKIYGKKTDEINIQEILRLNGEHARGIAKSTIFATDLTKAHVINEAYGNAAYTMGHIECNEIVKGENVSVSTIPVLKVVNEKSELTHEASVGRIKQDQLDILMSKGLSEEEATSIIINGLIG